MQDDTDTELDAELDFMNDTDDLGIDPFGDSGNSPIEKHPDLLKDLTNFDPIIQSRVRNWVGLEYDKQADDYLPTGVPIINSKGAKWAIGVLQTYQSRTNFITNINEREFKNLHLDILKLVWIVFPTIDEFEVNCTADWYRLCTELEHSAFLVLAGAGDGKYTKFLGESVQRNENVTINPNQRVPMYNPVKQQTTKGWMKQVQDKLLGRS